MIPSNRAATHPGVILLKEFLEPLGLTPAGLANHLDLPVEKIEDLVQEKRSVSPELAWFLSEALDTTPEFWVNLQSIHDLSVNRPNRHVQSLASAIS